MKDTHTDYTAFGLHNIPHRVDATIGYCYSLAFRVYFICICRPQPLFSVLNALSVNPSPIAINAGLLATAGYRPAEATATKRDNDSTA